MSHLIHWLHRLIDCDVCTLITCLAALSGICIWALYLTSWRWETRYKEWLTTWDRFRTSMFDTSLPAWINEQYPTDATRQEAFKKGKLPWPQDIVSPLVTEMKMYTLPKKDK